MTMKQYIVAFLAIIGLFGGGYAALQYNQNEMAVGGDLVTPIAGQTYTLAGAGIGSSDTSFTLTSFTITQTGYRIQDSDMSDIFYVTLEPGSRSRQEIVSCTTVTQNNDGSATISGCIRGLLPIAPYTASTSLAFAHAGGSSVIFSDPPQLFNQTTFKDNDETITGSWLFPTPLSSDNAATKAYVDALVSGTTTLSNDRLVVAGTAGETLATSTLVYFNPATQRWNGVSSAATTTFDDRFIGLTQGAGTNGTAVRNGILLKGRHTLSTGLTPGALYYAATATGTISTVASAQTVGIAESATVLYFDPVWIDVPTENGDNVFTGSNTFTGPVFFTGSTTGAIRTQVLTYNASTTWTKQPGLNFVRVQAWGGGGSGAANSGINNAGGGGGGGYMEVWIMANDLPSTVNAVIGSGGAAVSGVNNGNAGGNSTFGSFITAFGGSGGTTAIGGNGGRVQADDTVFRGAGVDNSSGGTGIYFGGGGGGDGDGIGGSALFGGGGGGGSSISPGSGNISIYGGNGGGGVVSGTAGSGLAPGGGGGAASGSGTSGAGANGRIIVTEYY